MAKRLDYERARKVPPEEPKIGAITDKRRRFNSAQQERLKREAALRRARKEQ